MFFKITECLIWISRYYYLLKNFIDNYRFIELEIKPLRTPPISWMYYYYLSNYYLNRMIDYGTKDYYQVLYRDSNTKRKYVLYGTIKDVFDYTRYQKQPNEVKLFIKCNIIINEVKSSIRPLIMEYDTKTKLRDIMYYNFYEDVNNLMNDVDVEIGKKMYNVRGMSMDLTLEDA